jgi:predicted MPP superfamily phosphohydrolase
VAYYYAHQFEPARIECTALSLRLPRLSPEFDGYRLVQMSDIHMNRFMTPERLNTLADLVNQQHPDLIALTGDFVTHNVGRHADDLIAGLRRLSAPDGVWAVLGNHDHWNGASYVESLLAEGHVTCLRNQVRTFSRAGALLHVAGVDDYWEDCARIDDVLAALPPDGAAILLAHEPDFADISAATGRFDLQLSGHTHGGQVVIPFLRPPVLPHYGRKYPSGLYRVGTMVQYTNRGVGMASPRFRFNCRPEITVFTLRCGM